MKHCNYEKLKPKLVKTSEKYMRQETEENKKYLTEMFQLISKNYTIE